MFLRSFPINCRRLCQQLFQPRLVLLLAALLTAPSIAQTQQAAELTLRDCYERALARSEQLVISELDIKTAEARYREAMSSLFPKISFDSVYRLRDNQDFGRIGGSPISSEDPANSTGSSSGGLGRSQFEASATLTQPLFHGFRDLLIADAEKIEGSALRYDLARKRELLFLDVATLYYQIVLARSDANIYSRAEKTLRDRVKELQRLLGLGQARDGEVLAAQSDLALLESNQARVTGSEGASKELLAFLVGIPATEFRVANETALPVIESIDRYLSQSKERVDLKAQQLRIEAQKSRVEAARRASWPTLDAVANAYPYEDPDRSREWEAAVTVSVPVFDGGRIASQTAQESYRAQALRAQNSETERLIERDIRVAYSNVQASLNEVKSLKKHRETAARNYEFQQKDYSLGIVANLDVLQAIRTLQDAELELARAESEAQINKIQLDVATGGVTP